MIPVEYPVIILYISVVTHFPVRMPMPPKSYTEAFTIAHDCNDKPIRKPVAAMTREEQLAALAYAAEDFDAALAEVEPIRPLVEASYMPESLEVSLQLIERCFAFEEVRQRALRLADAVTMAGAN